MPALRLIAGSTARERIEEHGLTPSLIRMVVGASGGPKWLVLRGLDRFVFGDWLMNADQTIDMVGSSIGAWRMTIASHPDPGPMLERFEEAYFGFGSEDGASPKAVSMASYRILEKIMGPEVRDAIVGNPRRNLNIVAVRCEGPTASETLVVEGAGLLAAASMNAISRAALGKFFKRAVFYSGRGVACSSVWQDFGRIDVKLRPTALHDALMASGSIPFAIEPVRDIEGAPEGVYRDGGVIDYHFDVPWSYDSGIVLYPHFYGHLTPGWFDKMRKTRRAGPAVLKQQLILAPSDEFVATLPHGRIPDRKNFTDMADTDRRTYWRQVVGESERLADEYATLLEKPGALMDRLETVTA
ncbi:patatin-like phospholipase family protein [Kordiimonas sp.]|uniref:patatin-like phospholipase family protein n=1 Tax=Kordiimonas sp. TaxID=1970157 RepID=UPI003A8DC69D